MEVLVPAATVILQFDAVAGTELDVVVWVIPSPLIQVTVVPAATVREVGLNWVITMQTWEALGVHPLPFDPYVLLLQARSAPRSASGAIRFSMFMVFSFGFAPSSARRSTGLTLPYVSTSTTG